jgi:hypothetical protein
VKTYARHLPENKKRPTRASIKVIKMYLIQDSTLLLIQNHALKPSPVSFQFISVALFLLQHQFGLADRSLFDALL